MTDSVIVAHNLIKIFPSSAGIISAVNKVNLEVARGETFGLIGPDGAGKTTLIRLLLGLLTRSGGESRVLGYDSMSASYAIRERTGYIAQRFALPPDMTVMENLRFFARIHGVSQVEQRRRIGELLEFAGLSQFTTRLAGELSGGMKKKLALACSLIHEPQLVLMDEPTLGVDPVSRREFWTLLGNLRAEKGMTIFVCTPYMDEAERCHRVGLMYRGRLTACDTPAAIKRQVPGRLLEIASSNVGQARALLMKTEGVLEVQSYGLLLHVFVDDPAARRPQIQAALGAQGITGSIRDIEPRLEDAFISLITRQGEEFQRSWLT